MVLKLMTLIMVKMMSKRSVSLMLLQCQSPKSDVHDALNLERVKLIRAGDEFDSNEYRRLLVMIIVGDSDSQNERDELNHVYLRLQFDIRNFCQSN